MYIIPLFFMVVGLVVAATIVIRKFPQLANVDLERLPQEREARKKREIIARRLDAEGGKLLASWLKRLSPVRVLWGQLQLKFRIYVGRIERLWHHEQRTKTQELVPPEEQAHKILRLLAEARGQFENGKHDLAEELYIAVVTLDPKSVPAYRGLGETYLAKGSLQEALETFQFLLLLTPQDDAVMVKIAEIAEQQGDIDQAIKYYQEAVVLNDALAPRFYHLAELLVRINEPTTAKEAIVSAVELEPKNPKYLDLLIEIGILCGDKELAEQGYQELRLVNPKNQKLLVFHDRIKSLVP